MADGRTHAAANAGLLTLVVAVGTAGIYLAPSPTTAALAAGAVLGATGGLAVTPDIDQSSITHEERRLIRLFAPVGYLWTLFWLPYGVAFAHRGFSHTVPQGTLTRMLYIGIPCAVLAWLLGLRPSVVEVQYLLIGCGGLAVTWMLQDILHLMLDGLWPGRAPWRKPRWQPGRERS